MGHLTVDCIPVKLGGNPACGVHGLNDAQGLHGKGHWRFDAVQRRAPILLHEHKLFLINGGKIILKHLIVLSKYYDFQYASTYHSIHQL